jgi:hypothetical protein
MASKYKEADNGGVVLVETGMYIPNDPMNADWQEYLAWDGTADVQFTQIELDNIAWDELRAERDRLLSATDFFMTQDYYNDKMTAQEQTDVKDYRDDLRDLPANTSDPHDVTWPTKPQIVIDNGI